MPTELLQRIRHGMNYSSMEFDENEVRDGHD